MSINLKEFGIPLKDEDLEALLIVSQVPASERVRFQIVVQTTLSLFAQSADRVKEYGSFEQQCKKYRRIGKLAKDLAAELNALNHNDQFVLGCYHYTNLQFGHVDDPNEKAKIIVRVMADDELTPHLAFNAAKQLTAGAEMIHSAAALYDWRKKAAEGRPSKSLDVPFNPNVSLFDRFVEALTSAVCSHGGDLVAYKSETNGSFNQFLDLLRPYMPPGFIPTFVQHRKGKIPGQARMARLVSRTKKQYRHRRPVS